MMCPYCKDSELSLERFEYNQLSSMGRIQRTVRTILTEIHICNNCGIRVESTRPVSVAPGGVSTKHLTEDKSKEVEG